MNTFKQGRRYLIVLIIATVLALALNVFIIVQSCLDGGQSTGAAHPVVTICKNFVNFFRKDAINDSNIDTFTLVIRKLVGHFGLYAFSGGLSSWAIYMWIKPLRWYKPYIYILISVIFGFLFSGLTELIQLFIPGRSGQFTDVLIDFSGYLFGLFIVLLILFFIYKSQNKKPTSD